MKLPREAINGVARPFACARAGKSTSSGTQASLDPDSDDERGQRDRAGNEAADGGCNREPGTDQKASRVTALDVHSRFAQAIDQMRAIRRIGIREHDLPIVRGLGGV